MLREMLKPKYKSLNQKMKIKMKKLIFTISTLVSCIFSSNAAFCQEQVQGTLSIVNATTVRVKIRSNTSFNAPVSAFSVNIQIPTSVTPQPTINTVSNLQGTVLGTTFAPTFRPVISVGGFYNYGIILVTSGATPFNCVASTEYDFYDISFNGITTTTNLRLAHLPDNTNPNYAFYFETGGTEDKSNYTNLFYGAGASNGGNINAYSYVGSSVVPINYNQFTANKVNDNADLRWEVANQTNLTSHFKVERSTDGVNFKGIQEIAANTLNGTASYNMLDENIGKLNVNVIYYRIKQVDTDGRFVYSDVRYVKVGNKGGLISANPNPVKDVTNLRIEVLENQNATLQLLDANGKQILTESLKLNKGLNTKQFDMSPLAAGVYVIRVVTENDEVLSQKVVKQ
jgi:Secretion system C-terminal sorting domain